MALADEVADFLLSTEQYITFGLGRLNFTLDDLRIDTEGYREIGHKVRQGAISVRPAQASAGSAVAAVYTSRLDKLSVPAGLDLSTAGPNRISQQAMIVHEATHAVADFHRYTMTGAQDEACAYIAGQLYAMTLGLRQRGGGPRAAAIIAAAQTVVSSRNMIAQTGQRLRSSDADITVLIQAITAHTSAYPDAGVQQTTDGIREGLLNPWYLPRN